MLIVKQYNLLEDTVLKKINSADCTSADGISAILPMIQNHRYHFPFYFAIDDNS